MSDMDDKLRAAYRGLPREEPGAAVDAAILAASRRVLAKPSASRRWAAPVSIAAVLVLAFGVTLRMQQEKPGVESPQADAVVPQAPTPPPVAEPPAKKKVAPIPQRKAAPAAKPDANVAANERKDLKDLAALAKEASVTQAPAAPAPAAAPAEAAPEARRKSESFALQRAPAAASADAAAPIDEPTRELEAIAKLRAEGRTEEADKALAEFRRKHPDYRIPDAMWERVKPR